MAQKKAEDVARKRLMRGQMEFRVEIMHQLLHAPAETDDIGAKSMMMYSAMRKRTPFDVTCGFK